MDYPTKLTATSAERSKPDPEGEYRINDETVPGLSLRVRPGGSKSYILRYRTLEGRQRLVTLGRWPDLTVDGREEEGAREAGGNLRRVRSRRGPEARTRGHVQRDGRAVAEGIREAAPEDVEGR